MEISNIKNNILTIKESGQYDLNFCSENDFEITILDNLNVDINLRNYSDKKIKINVGSFSVCNVKLIIENAEKTLDLHGFSQKSSKFNVYFADFSNGNSELKIESNLLGEESKSDIRYSSISNDLNLKKYQILINHLNSKTKSNFEGYGVATKTSEIVSNCISHIYEKCIKSEAHQISKIILFDEKSKAHADPVLKIDCDDVIASHGVAIGALNNDHIFYLKSRGLSDEEARKLIVLGYLLPIKDYFNEKDAERIAARINGDF